MSGGESNSDMWSLRSDGARAVGESTALAREFVDHHRLDEYCGVRLAIVIEEIVLNAVEHGQVGPLDEIALMLRRDRGGVRIVLEEPGLPFDPREAVPDPQARERRGGGAGLDLVKAWTRIVDYRTAGGVNRLELYLPFDEPER